jgi:DNA-binding protein
MSNLFEHTVSRSLNLPSDKDYDLIEGLNGMINTKMEEYVPALIDDLKDELLNITISSVGRDIEREVSDGIDTAVSDFMSDVEYKIEDAISDGLNEVLTDSLINTHVEPIVENCVVDLMEETVRKFMMTERGKQLLKEIVYESLSTTQRQAAD